MSSSQDSRRDKERELRIKHLYGRTANKPALLGHQLEKRKYFDSGDFALAQAHRSSNVGKVETGSQHPLRRGISHPILQSRASAMSAGIVRRTGGVIEKCRR
ncbi:hypothetical protein JDV02_001400 [Purpureocillium takamizusanense]|uniref:mRNA stability protein n=1 Tax=Purpureocillium takamizusanense TaxID=2060973 RepID=A0A9Q8Q830_9HYPO|nr:uncharacterized protein JDV02_001400 [Purpureocillium takamizusanense]UNI14805.1 hypothetical protein JDV02_001400 [Purpureocillium takamizusanense]